MTNTAADVLKKEGEDCGPCFSPGTNFSCGVCKKGLECASNVNDSLIADAPRICRKKIPKKDGEYCGPCLDQFPNSFCGDCDKGLRCVKSSDDSESSEVLAIAKCEKKSGVSFFLFLKF